MPGIFKRRIVKLLKHTDLSAKGGVKLAQLARRLGVSSEDYPQFKSAFEERFGQTLVLIERVLS